MSGRTLVALIFLAAAVGLTLKAVGATHDGTNHCIEDPNSDQVVDITDIVIFAGNFGHTGPAHLDVAPQMGDGFIDITDLTHVAGYFGKPCYGFVEVGSAQLNMAMGVSECEFWVSGFGGFGETPDYSLIKWGGKTYCEGTIGLYETRCWFQLWRWDGQQWVLEVVSLTVSAGGLYCATDLVPNWLPRNTPLMAGLSHTILRDGAVVHATSDHTNGYIFEIP